MNPITSISLAIASIALLASVVTVYRGPAECHEPDLVICAEPRGDETQCWLPGRQWVCLPHGCTEVSPPWPKVEGWTWRRLP